MLVWKELAVWRRFFRWLGPPIRTLRDKLEVKWVTRKDFRNVTVTVTKGTEKTTEQD